MIFGDAQPEDAWHPDDPVAELLVNLARRCAALGVPVDLAGDDRDRLDQIIYALAAVRARIVPGDELAEVRAGLIADDVNFLLGRIVREAVDRG